MAKRKDANGNGNGRQVRPGTVGTAEVKSTPSDCPTGKPAKPAAQPTAEQAQPAGGTVTIELPWSPVSETAHLARHVEVTLDRPQRVALRALFNALNAEPPARLKSGRYVQSPPDAVRWMLEQLAGQLGIDKDGLGIAAGKE
jgi:hypothetical protein